MPNCCRDSITITGKGTDKINKLLKPNGDDDSGMLDDFFRVLIPMPKEYNDTDSPNMNKALSEQLLKKYGARDWYDWNIGNWGIKWDLSEASYEYRDNSIMIECESPWGPPLKGLRAVAKQYNVDIEIHYAEPGMDFGGITIFHPEDEEEVIEAWG